MEMQATMTSWGRATPVRSVRRFVRLHGRSLLVLLIGIIVVLPAVLMWARVHPSRIPLDDDPGRHGLRYEDIAFPSPLDGTILRGWYILAPRPTGRAVIVVPGIDSNRLVSGITLRLAADLVADGFDVLALDLRDQGESGGDTLSFGAREQYDVVGAVAVARARGARHVAVIGFSMGAAAAMLAAARTPDIDALVLDSAYADLRDTLGTAIGSTWHVPGPLVAYALLLYGVLSGTDPASVVPADAIRTLWARPMLFIAGADDRAVRPTDGAAMATAAGAKAAYVLVPGAGHVGAFFVDPSAYAGRVRAFLAAALPPEPSGRAPRARPVP
jgi:pimeloyl-ACP methyl ester carboxylesterase